MRWLAVVGVLVAAWAAPEIASAQFTVNSFSDTAFPGPCTPEPFGCTLREAMQSTPDGAIVDLPAGEYHVTEGPLLVGDGRFLVGAGARTTTITADNLSRVMMVDAGDMSIRDVTISDGSVVDGLGGGIFVGLGTDLNLFDSAVVDNTAGTGGGIYSAGTLHVERSTIASNVAEGEIPRGGGLAVLDGDAQLLNTTISANFSAETGAGLYTEANVVLRNVTIARNVSEDPDLGGVGLQQAFDEPGSDRTVAFNTLVAENDGGNCLGTGGTDGLILSRYGMSDDLTCEVVDPTINFAPFPAVIGPLSDNGGPTDTHQLFGGSHAIGRAETGSCEQSFDQRGLARPHGADGCDIGSYERAGALTATTQADQSHFCTESDCSLREAIDLVGSGGEVEVLPGEYQLPLGELVVSRDVVVRGVGARVVTLRGSGSRVMRIVDEADVTVSGVRITGGDVTQFPSPPLGSLGGGIAVEEASLHLIDSAVDNNVAGNGGGILARVASLRLTDTTVASNDATDSEIGQGGGLLLVDASATVVNSTISGNTAEVRGGGIRTLGTELNMANVTIAENSTEIGLGSAISRETTPIGNDDRGETVARNLLVAGNPGDDCHGNGPFESTNGLTGDTTCPGTVIGDAMIGGLAANDGETDTHALMSGSPAIDAGANCELADQRGVRRPQGSACDVGAYERIVASEPSGGGGGTTQPPPEEEQELPSPEAGEEVNAVPKSGTVRVKVAGTNRFVELEEGQQIPVGSVVDTTKGRVTIVAAGNQSADFYDGIFRIGQGKGAKPLTTLTLVEALSCPKAGRAMAAAKKKKRRLWGDGSGKFRTKGKHSAATVVGTRWLVEDRCTSTLTRVVRGRVSVRDFVKKKTVVVNAGKKYVARARR